MPSLCPLSTVSVVSGRSSASASGFFGSLDFSNPPGRSGFPVSNLPSPRPTLAAAPARPLGPERSCPVPRRPRAPGPCRLGTARGWRGAAGRSPRSGRGGRARGAGGSSAAPTWAGPSGAGRAAARLPATADVWASGRAAPALRGSARRPAPPGPRPRPPSPAAGPDPAPSPRRLPPRPPLRPRRPRRPGRTWFSHLGCGQTAPRPSPRPSLPWLSVSAPANPSRSGAQDPAGQRAFGDQLPPSLLCLPHPGGALKPELV